MTNPESKTVEERDASLTVKQVIEYGRDLARVYVLEKEKREQLQIANQMLEALFANAPSALLVLDHEFSLQHANVEFYKLLGLTADTAQYVGMSIEALLGTDALNKACQAADAEHDSRSEFELTISQPVTRVLSARIQQLQTKTFSGWIIVLQDLTQQKRLAMQKSEFISIAAHELRTPLGSILGYTTLLNDDLAAGKPIEESAPFITAIIKGANEFKAKINELINFAELEQGDYAERQITEVSLKEIAQKTLAELRPLADEQLVTLHLLIPDDLPPLQVEAATIHSVLYELLNNGINFNHAGGLVRLEAEQYGDGLRLRFIDTGVGIEAADQCMIFQSFYQVSEPNTRSQGGLGLGLSIAQKAVQRLGGEINVSSTRKEGTTFTVDLPLQQPSPLKDVERLRKELEIKHQQSLVYAKDIQTLYRQLQQKNVQLRETNMQLEESNKLKSDFLAVIGHELRSPFVSVDMALQTLHRHGVSNLSADQQTLIGEITTYTKQAFQMVDRLVKYANLLDKQGKLKPDYLDLTELLPEVVDTLRPLAQRRSITLTLNIHRPIDIVLADRELVSDALWHLIHNAIKFTPHKGQIEVSAHRGEAYISLEVKDNGVGISEEKQAMIWEPFAQLSDALRRGVEGLGLGLPFVRYVAAAHKGRVIVHSKEGVGSVFGFWLPLAGTTSDADDELL
ncbi:MAG: HAMP domain-containing histidine kinase [Anaerolineae bacterium]|nr:HAMP domain-containing histidine kinase [Anaerolineae bacterium]